MDIPGIEGTKFEIVLRSHYFSNENIEILSVIYNGQKYVFWREEWEKFIKFNNLINKKHGL